MERPQSIKAVGSKICVIAFIAGIALLLLECAGYLMGIRSSGILFTIGMLLVVSTGAISAATSNSKHKTEEVLTMLIAFGFFCWIGWKAFLR